MSKLIKAKTKKCEGVIYHVIRFRVNHFQFKKFSDAQKIGYTQKEVVQKLIDCNGLEFTMFDKLNNESVTFPKNFLKEKNK